MKTPRLMINRNRTIIRITNAVLRDGRRMRLFITPKEHKKGVAMFATASYIKQKLSADSFLFPEMGDSTTFSGSKLADSGICSEDVV